MDPLTRLGILIAAYLASAAALWGIGRGITALAELRQGRRLDRSRGGR